MNEHPAAAPDPAPPSPGAPAPTAAGAPARSEPLVPEVLEAYLPLDQPQFSVADVARSSGIEPAQLQTYWRALGFPEGHEGEALFTQRDVEMLSAVVTLIADGALDPEVAIQMARVIGSSLDRIAAAQVDALVTRVAEHEVDPAEERRRTLEFAAIMPRILEFVWRRQLAAAAQRRLLRSAVGAATPVCVGFADLVGFTAQTQQLDQASLAKVVGRFEAIAYDVVAGHRGRVVKTIGDEVMFLADDVRTGAELALDLARTYREDPDLSDVRVGLASGPVLERDGDVFGHTVNLASRIVSIAYPGSVLVSADVHDALVDDPRFELRSLRHHHLKDIGRVPLWRLRFADDPFERSYDAARDRRSLRRQLLQEQFQAHDVTARALARRVQAGEAPTEGLPERLAQVLAGTAPIDVIDSFAESPTPDELDALAEVVLDAELDEEVQLELLTDLGAAQALRELDLEADRRAAEADEEAEQRLRRIEEETARRVAKVEREAREKIAAAIARAEEESRKVDLEAARRVERVLAETERKAEQARRDARARAARQAQRARRRAR